MVKRGWGRIVFISGESGLNIPVEMIHYGMTRRRNSRSRWALPCPSPAPGVTVNAVVAGGDPFRRRGRLLPAKLASERGVSEDELERQFIATYRPTSLIRRLATVEEVAIWWSSVLRAGHPPPTGAALRVDGGMLRSIACAGFPPFALRASDPEESARRGRSAFDYSGVVAELRQQICHVADNR